MDLHEKSRGYTRSLTLPVRFDLQPTITDPRMRELVQAARNVLIIKLGAPGHIVLDEGALHDIRLHHPNAKVTALTTPA